MAPASPATARWLDTESSDLVRDFWRAAGEVEAFPRALERPLSVALPVTLVKLAHLHVHDTELWLRARGIPLPFAEEPGAARSVHGCIVVLAGHGILFVDGADNAAELRFTIAHEIGHFLADHLLPRRKALAHYGDDILDVLDAKRQPTERERWSSILGGLQLDGYRSYLPRGEGDDSGLELWRVESRADRIGAALLAPPGLVLSAARGYGYSERRKNAIHALTSTFGLPLAPAIQYAEALLYENRAAPTWAETFFSPAT